MVKNKKLSKSSIAIIVLAVLLIASLVMGMTGAWFTSRPPQKSSNSIKFGTVSLNVGTEGERNGWVINTDHANHPYLENTHAMPGDTIVGTFNLDNEGDAAWVFMTYGGTVVRTFSSLSNEEKASILEELNAGKTSGDEGYVAEATEANTLSYRTEPLAQLLPAGDTANKTALATAGWNNFDAIAPADWSAATLGDAYEAPTDNEPNVAGSFKTMDGASIYYIELTKDDGVESSGTDYKVVVFNYALLGNVFVDKYQGATIEVHIEFVAVQAANRKVYEAAKIAFGEDLDVIKPVHQEGSGE